MLTDEQAQARDIALVDELLSLENALVEFKKDNSEPNRIGKYCSALSNAARIENVDFAYLLWGIDDAFFVEKTR